MTFDQVKRLAIGLLKNYEAAWKENSALHSLLRSVPMSDGTKGIPNYEQMLERYLANEQVNTTVHRRFDPMYDQIENAQQDSDLLELLRKVPPVGGIQ
jgi:hypothetical protein